MSDEPIAQLRRFWLSLGLPAGRWPAAGERFGTLLDLIATHNLRAGLTAPPLTGRDFYLKHVADSLAVLGVRADLLAGPVELADVGSGAGLPGLVLAIALAELRLTAIESNRKKAAFIELAAGELGLARRVEVVARRSREIGHDERFVRRFAVVVARAVAPAGRLIRDCRLLIAPGGSAILYKTPAAVRQELPLARREAARHKLTVEVSDPFDLPAAAGKRQLMIVTAPK